MSERYGYRKVAEKTVRAAKDHVCAVCDQPIAKGSTYARTFLIDEDSRPLSTASHFGLEGWCGV